MLLSWDKMKEEFNNRLMNRKEVSVVLTSDSNPGFVQVQKELADKFKVSEEVIAVKKISSSFGRKEFVVDAFIYDSAKDKLVHEPKKKEKKGENK